jgi:hypothetical protein
MLVRDFLDLPAHVTADDFVVRPDTDVADLAKKYTLTTAIEPKLDELLRATHEALAGNRDIGRFVFGSFGSGKSHFLRIAGMMLANDRRLYDNTTDARLLELRNKHAWLEEAKILVVPVSMVGADPQVSAFTRALAAGFDAALRELGLPEAHVFGTAAAFARFDALCEKAPATFDAFARDTGYDRPFYDEMRADALGYRNAEGVLAFAKQIAKFILGDEMGFQPAESEAREQMAAHAKKLGFKAIGFEVDEFVIWAQGLTGGGYAAAVNALNALVESNEVRPVRFIVLAAIQRSIMSFFPETGMDDKLLRDQLSRVKDRFPEVRLEDNNLFEIAERRVLTSRPDRAAEWKTQVAAATQRLSGASQGVLVGDEPVTALTQLYPFHPALLRVLSDVSQGLQRARSSLFMLYQLVTEIRPNLEIGQLISLGALWDVLFAPEHLASLETYAPKDQPTHHANRLIKTHATWERLRSSINTATEGNAGERDILDLVVKSALLAQLSHSPFVDAIHGLDAAITVENLFRLNRADIPAMSEMTGTMKVGKLLAKLATLEPSAVLLDGTGQTAKVKIELDAIDLTELLALLRPASLFSTLLAQTKNVLGFPNVSGTEGRLAIDWRYSSRSGRIRFETFEQFSTSGRENTLSLEPNDEFKIAILMENDFGGSAQQAIDNARAKIESARDQSQVWAAAWIPNPLSNDGREQLERLAKVELFEEKRDDYLGRFRTGEHGLVKQRMGAIKLQAQMALSTALANAYVLGRVITLRKEPPELFATPNVDLGKRLPYYVGQLMDRRYQQHPKFLATPTPSALNKLLALDRRLLEDPTKNVLGGEDFEVAKKLGEPLELYEPGVGVTNVKNGGLYLEKVRECVTGGDRRVSGLLERLGREPFGIQRAPAQLLIATFALRQGYRVTHDGRPRSVDTIGELDPRAELTSTVLPSAPDWNAARNAASALFGIDSVPNTLHVGNVDSLIIALREPIEAMRGALGRASSAFGTLFALGAYTGESPVAKRYGNALLAVAALSEDATVVKRLAQLDLAPFGAAFAAAAVDAPALETLRDFTHLGGIVKSMPVLRADLARILTSDLSSLAPDIRRWLKEADAYMDSLIKRDASIVIERAQLELRTPLSEDDLAVLTAQVREVALRAKPGEALEIEIRVVPSTAHGRA